MKNFKQFCRAAALLCILSPFALAGEMGTPPSTAPGEMGTPPTATAPGEMGTPPAGSEQTDVTLGEMGTPPLTAVVVNTMSFLLGIF